MSASNCHFLIGIPGSGKSTFATTLAKGNYVIVSTDEIRATLYGDPAIQGNWHEVENQALLLIENARKSGKSIIYDATNFKRAFRMDFLMKLELKSQNSKLFPLPTWIAWYIKTPIKTCIEWNQKRNRQVPQEIIESMSKVLLNFPPLAAEGFAAVEEIDMTKFSTDTTALTTQIEKRINNLQRSTINRHNRTQHDGITFHRYSRLLDFDRLMHLISLIIKYPNIGNIHATNSILLEKILGNIPEITNHLDEITLIIALHGTIYAQPEEISADLQWLEENDMISGGNNTKKHISSPLPTPDSPFLTHAYSHTEPFQRLIGTIRFILHHPFLLNTSKGNLATLAQALQQAGILGGSLDSLRKDIEKVLKPYQILPDFSMRNGYFAGTAILSQQELIKVFEILQSQAQSLDDPLALEIYETFKQRMLQTKLIDADKEVYPVRSIANRSIVDPRYLHSTALANNLLKLEYAISSGELLELNRFAGSAGYNNDPKSFFLAYPLQIVFSNLAWYLGFECISGDQPGLLRFERLDRLFLGKPQLQQQRLRSEQEKSLQQLQALLKGSAGLFLGNSAAEQHNFLSQDKQVREKACITVELWFNDYIYKFITEGTKRFAQIKMSPPSSNKTNLPKSIFSLKPTGDKQFPHRFQAILPKWSLDDFDFWRWVVGFGGNVKVVTPTELVEKVKGIGNAIIEVYEK